MILTTANLVKAGGFWCENATEITQAALDSAGADWDTKLPIIWGLDNLGLANTILALGSVIPEHKQRADAVVTYLLSSVTNEVISKESESDREMLIYAIGNPRRKKLADRLKMHLVQDTPYRRALAVLLDHSLPAHMRLLHATKEMLDQSPWLRERYMNQIRELAS